MTEEPKDIDTIPEGGAKDEQKSAPPPPAEKKEIAPAAERPPEHHETPRENHPVTLERRKPLSQRNKSILIVAGAVLVLIVVAILTVSISFSDSTEAVSYPYTTTYDVIFPNSEKVQLGNVDILAIPQQDKVTLSVNKKPDEILLNETKEISARRAAISMLGISILKFDFKVLAEYRGMVGSDARFYLSVKTSNQVPAFVVDRLLPAGIQARPA